MFGQSDKAINEARDLAKTAIKLQKTLTDERAVLKSARAVSKVTGDKADILKQYGITPGDVDAINAKIDQLDAQIEGWNRWATDPALVQQVRQAAGLAPAEAAPAPAAPAPAVEAPAPKEIKNEDGSVHVVRRIRDDGSEVRSFVQTTSGLRVGDFYDMGLPVKVIAFEDAVGISAPSDNVWLNEEYVKEIISKDQIIVGIRRKTEARLEKVRAEIREMIKDGDTDLINQKNAEALGFVKRGDTYEETPSPAVEAPPPVKAINPRTGQTEMIGQEEGGFQLTGETVRQKQAPAVEGDAMFSGAETRGRALDDLDAKGLADLKKVAQREGVDLMRGSVDLAKLGADKVREAIREARAAQAPRSGELAGRGEAKVPPGPAQGAGTIPHPDWVLQKAESPTGRSLLKKVAGATDGKQVGVRSIVDFLNDAVGVEMRRSKSQTSKRHPAHYRPTGHVAFTRNTMSQINFHEAGHGLKELVEARLPGWFDSFKGELLALTKVPGSMASAENIHEGVAEWLRLRVVNPFAVDQMRISPAMDQMMAQTFPGLAEKLRDASRAMHAFYEKPADVRWSMFANAPRRATLGGLADSLARGSAAVSDFFSSGAPLSRLDRQLFKAIVKEREEAGLSLRAAIREARKVRGTTQGLLAAHNMVLQIGSETQMAMTGQGPMRGIRVVGPDGNFVRVLPKTWQEVVRSVPPAKWQQFQEAGWAREALNRYENDKLEYPGMRDGVRPEDLRAIVNKAARDIPDFEKRFKDVQAFFDAVLDVKEMGGLKAPGEVERMRTREDYWPLPRVMESYAHTVRGRGHISAGDFRAKGSGEAIKSLSEVAEERVRDAMTAYYWNRLGLKMAAGLTRAADNTKLPMEARAMAGRVFQPLKMERTVAATVSKEEVIGWILKDLNAQKAEELGRPLTKEEQISAEDVNLSWDFKDVWRPTAPKDYHVISLLSNGERRFFQVQDPSLFNLFSSPDQASRAAKAIQWALGPSLQNWKRGITQSIPFSLNNIMGDLFNQVMLNRDAIGWFPGGASMLGVINRFTKKYPEAFQEGLLLARVEPSSVELLNQVKHNAVWQFLTEGFYVSQAKDPAARFLLTVLQPSNWLFPLWKVADLVNLVTGGKAAAPFLEGATREGAAVFKKMSGGTDEEANYAYWRVTGTFNEHAGIPDFRVAMSMPGFFNPMIQAVRGAGQNLTDPDPAVSGSAWTKLLLLIPSVFAGAAYIRFKSMSEEDKKKERERTITDRASYHDVAGMRIRFPYGPEGAMASLVYNSVMDDLLQRTPADASVATRNALSRIAGIGSPLEFLGPQIKAATEGNMNWSTFRQQHIVAPWMTGLPASEQYYSTTPEFYKKLGRWADLSPAKIQYFVQNGLNNQVDETIRILDNMERNRPIGEKADLPFVGRMFIRDPAGFASASVQSIGDIDQKIKLLDSRINAAGYGYLRNVAGFTPAEQALQVQLAEVKRLRDGVSNLQRLMKVSKFQSIAQDWTAEDNTRRAMTVYAQSVLAANPEAAERIEQAISMLENLSEKTPKQKAADYGVRGLR
jgi:hypothetical protein